MHSRCYIFTLLLTVLPIAVTAHSWPVRPPAFNTNFPTKDCMNAECTNACPPILDPTKMRNTPKAPAAVWKRGAKERICYARNKHHGGIASFSIVPVNVMNEKAYHSLFKIFTTCWDAGKERCRAEKVECGTDDAFTFCRDFHVPTQIPDGDYVFGYQWFGGLKYNQKEGKFPDFWSCSFITIEGGEELNCDEAHMPYFEPGTNQGKTARKTKHGKCRTAVDRVNICGNKGCEGKKSFSALPFPFDREKYPDEKISGFTCDDHYDAKEVHTAAVDMLDGLCKEQVCCHKKCKSCGGNKCNKDKMGGDNCCITPIINSKRYCGSDKAPCIRPEFKLP